jgi:hypothetical protein
LDRPNVRGELIEPNHQVDLAALPGAGSVLERFLGNGQALRDLIGLSSEHLQVGLHVDQGGLRGAARQHHEAGAPEEAQTARPRRAVGAAPVT